MNSKFSRIHRFHRGLSLLFAISLFLGTSPVRAAQTVQQLTNNTSEEGWGDRHSTTSRGKVLWFDENSDIFFYNGTSVSLVQAFDANDPSLDDIDDIVFALGSGASPGQVVGWLAAGAGGQTSPGSGSTMGPTRSWCRPPIPSIPTNL